LVVKLARIEVRLGKMTFKVVKIYPDTLLEEVTFIETINLLNKLRGVCFISKSILPLFQLVEIVKAILVVLNLSSWLTYTCHGYPVE